MSKRTLAAVTLVAASLAAPPIQAQAEPGDPPDPQPVVVLNHTRFEPLAQDVVVPAGESRRFEARSDNFARVSLLVAGATTPGSSGAIRLATLYGPPVVPAGPPRRLAVDARGGVRGQFLEPVLGPVLFVVVGNDSSSDVTLSLSAYLAN